MTNTYAYYKPSEAGLQKISVIQGAFSGFTDLIENTCPKSRELSIALTNLEQASMWAVRSIVRNDPESKTEEEMV